MVISFIRSLCTSALLVFAFSLSINSIQAQTPVYKANPVSDLRDDSELNEQFTAYQAFEIPINSIMAQLRSADIVHQMEIDLPGYGLLFLQMEVNPLKADNYLRKIQTENGIIREYDLTQKTYKGYTRDGARVRLTIDEHYFAGLIKDDKSILYFEPLNYYVEGADKDAVVFYYEKDVRNTQPGTCKVKLAGDSVKDIIEGQLDQADHNEQRALDECLQVEIALADDWLMFDDYDDVAGVENHNLTVINNVQTNYDDEFADMLIFDVVEIFVVTCEGCDPWTNSTNPDPLLDDFTDWGPSGFDNVHDVASLWTARNFNGSTIGLAWVSSVCGFGRYNVLEDFTSNAALKRVLQAHELGHNFSANHDAEGSNFIMAPSVGFTNDWSAASITKINNKVNNVGCFANCPPAAAPEPDFIANITSGCSPLSVSFTDLSTQNAEDWDWTFPGGSPSSSSQQNPTVTYNTPGVYDVILEVSNGAGSNTLVLQDYIEVIDDPIADFTADIEGVTVFFTSFTNANSYFWEFGDGQTSTQQSPTHVYDEGGEFDVTLTVSTDCGDATLTITIELIAPPVADFSTSSFSGCEPFVVQFINESAPAGGVNSYFWSFPGGTPTTSTLANPVVTYNEPGLYDIELTVENPSGIDFITITEVVEVNPLPEAGFNFVVENLDVSFFNSSSFADSYTWYFGDGQTSTSASPVHSYAQGGSYDVMLVSENNCGHDTLILPVALTSEPLALYQVSMSSGCAPLSVTYTNSSQGQITFQQWSFPGGNPSTSSASSVNVTYNSPGLYDVQLIVGNASGSDTLIDFDVVEVLPNPVSAFSYEVIGDIVDFSNQSQNANSYNWNFGDGESSTDPNPLHVYQQDGTYDVTLIVTGPCGTDTFTSTVVVSTLPTAGFSASQTGGCQPFEVQFFNSSTSNATEFLWSFPGGTPSTSDEENPVVMYEEAGVYPVSLTVWSGAGSHTAEEVDFITVDPLPVASFNTVVNGLQVQFNNQSQNGTTFEWFFGDGQATGEPSPTHVFGDLGEYEVLLVATNSCGKDSLALNVVVSTSPIPLFSSNAQNGCVPMEVQFQDESQNGVESWSWSFPGGTPDTSNAQNPVVTYNTPGVYPVILKVTNASGSIILVKESFIHVAEQPVADFEFETNTFDVEFFNQSINGDSYSWDFGDGSTNSSLNPSHTYTDEGEYLVRLVVRNVCSTDTIEKLVLIMTSGNIDLETPKLTLEIAPNPNNGKFFLTIAGSVRESTGVYVFDMLGQVVFYQKGFSATDRTKIPIELSDMSSGVYVIQVQTGNQKVSKKLVIE